MGCCEINLADTTGTGMSERIGAMIEEVGKKVPTLDITSLANIFTVLRLGRRTFDSSLSGLGVCLYSPDATDNVATEQVLYALYNLHYRVEAKPNLNGIIEIGAWVLTPLQKENVSRAGRAILAKKQLEYDKKEKEKEKQAKL